MEKICPVCAAKAKEPALAELSCPKCGFEYAYVDYFGSETSLALWKRKAEEKKARLRADRAELLSGRDCFVLGGREAAYVSVDEKKLSILGEDGFFEEKQNVRQYSRSERNSAVLFENGKLALQGDNSYGQCDLRMSEPAVFVLCAPNCIYAVGESGKVSAAGAVADESVRSWQDITALAAGSFHLLGITKDKKVRIAGEMIERSVLDKVSGWENVRAVCAATDCSIALFEDGSVSFAGRQNDPRSEAENWKDIVSVKADSSYAVGLTKEGNIRMAGSCKAYLDMGRSTAAQWKNVVAIACSRSGIAAILADGSLKITGNFSGDVQEICRKWKEQVNI